MYASLSKLSEKLKNGILILEGHTVELFIKTNILNILINNSWTTWTTEI